jgi:hypothetical protein
VRNVLHINGAHNSLLQLWLMDRKSQIVPVNGYEIKIDDKAPAESTSQGRGNLVGVSCHTRWLFWLDVKRLDVKVSRMTDRARGSCFVRRFKQALCLFSFELSTTVVIPPWRSVGTDLSGVIT